MRVKHHDEAPETKPEPEPTPETTGPTGPAPMARRALEKLRGAWLKTQPATYENSGSSVEMHRDEAAALFVHVCMLAGKEPA